MCEHSLPVKVCVAVYLGPCMCLYMPCLRVFVWHCQAIWSAVWGAHYPLSSAVGSGALSICPFLLSPISSSISSSFISISYSLVAFHSCSPSIITIPLPVFCLITTVCVCMLACKHWWQSQVSSFPSFCIFCLLTFSSPVYFEHCQGADLLQLILLGPGQLLVYLYKSQIGSLETIIT